MPKRAAILAAVAFWLMVAMSAIGWAEGEKLLIVVLDKVTWHDLLSGETNAPALRQLAEEGGVGMMCVRAGRGGGGGYLTIGAGARASSAADPETGVSLEAQGYQSGESVEGAPALRRFRAMTGWPVGDNEIVHLGIGALIRQNADAAYPLRLGLLGGTLRRSGVRVACVGNSDTARSVHREVVAIGMDEQGLVGIGSVGPGLRRGALPYGVGTDEGALSAAFRRAAAAADVVVMDLGETSRADEYAGEMTPAAARAARSRAIERADRMLAEALSLLGRDRWAVLVITPELRAPDPEETFAGLAPVIWWVPGSGAGLLTSSSTRRPGLIANTDIAPTVLSYFGLPLPAEVVGRPIAFASASGKPIVRLKSDLLRHDAVEQARRPVFRALPILGALALWVSAFLLLVGERVPGAVRALVRGLLLIALSAPAGMLLITWRPLPADQMLAASAALAVVIALLSSWFLGWRSGHVIPALLTVALLAYDLFRGQQMLCWSPLSYSPAAGARFYGIGNEYAGALLGASLVGASALLWPRERAGSGERFLVGFAVLALAILVGLPRYGANLGMSLASVVGAAIFILYLWRRDVGWPEVIVALFAGFLVVAGAIVADMIFRGPEASHIGRFVAAVRREGWQTMSDVVLRKLALNWTLVRASLWTDVAAAALGVLGVSVAARPPRVMAALRERSWLGPALIACFAGAAAAFLLNDSGVVAAALVLLYGAGSLAYVSLGDVGLEA